MMISKKHAVMLALVIFCVIGQATAQNQAEEPEIETHNTKYQPNTGFIDVLVNLPHKFIQNIDQYYIEIGLVMLALIYILNYFNGKNTNLKMAATWVQENREVFDQNFAAIGVSNGKPGPILDEDSANGYKFYATGRVNCNYALVSLDLQKRQDLLSMYVLSFIWPEKDRVTIEIPIDLKTPIPIVFAAIKKREVKKMQEANPDIKGLCRKLRYDSLANDYVVLGEFEETTDYVLSESIVSMLNKNANLIQLLSFSDQRYAQKLVLRCEMLLSSNLKQDGKKYSTILRGLFYMVDQIVNYKMSQGARQKAEQERQALEKAREKENAEKRNEELQKKKEEKRKAEEERMKSMSKEALRKLEEKEQKREQKKKLRSKYVKV